MSNNTTNYNLPLPTAIATSKRLTDIQLVRDGLVATDAALAIVDQQAATRTADAGTALTASISNTITAGLLTKADVSHSHVKSQVGLSNVDNTADIDKPISTAVTTALSGKAAFSHGHSKAEVGLANVDNTSDVNKPISIATQAALNTKVNTSTLGMANGVATLDASGSIPSAQLPSYVDDVLEVANQASLPAVGETGKIYVAIDTNKTYRWTGAIYVYITSGAVDSVNNKTGVVTLVKNDLGLGSVDNTSDAAKPVSTAQSAAINAAQAAAISTAATDATTKANTAQANAIAASAPVAHVGATGSAHGTVTGSVNGFMIAADKTKLDAITGTNTGDETLATIQSKLGITTLSGSNTGDQTTITGNAGSATTLQTARTINGVSFNGSANITINAVDATARVASSLLGAVNGVATLDASGTVLTSQLPSYVDDVLEGANLASFPATGEAGKIYVALDTNKTYRWSGSVYVYITSGAVDSVAGKTGAVSLIKGDVGLGNVDNTTDAAKPVSTAAQTIFTMLTSAIHSLVQTLTNKTIEAGIFTKGYTEQTLTASTAGSYTIDLNNGTLQVLTLTGNTTFTAPAIVAGKSFTLILKQDATGSRTVTWPVSVKWPGGTSPVMTATANKRDKVIMTCDGIDWLASNGGQNY